MPRQNQKTTLLYLSQILQEHTDPDSTLNAEQIREIMEKTYGVTVDRRTVYADIEVLRASGMDIRQIKGSTPGYYIKSRLLDIAELKLLVDAVQSSRFITEKKSQELIEKLESIASREKADELRRQVYISNRVKTGNEAIYEAVDQIHRSIYRNRKVSFQYTEWNEKKQLCLRRDGRRYEVSPWALTWNEENYYLVAFDSEAGAIRHYRVDKMIGIRMLDEEREGEETFRDFDLAAFCKKTFGMYGGEEKKVVLRCHNSLAGVMIDRFGQDVMMMKDDEEHFRLRISVAVSPQFFGWLSGIGSKVQIVSPDDVRSAYRSHLEEILKEN